MTHSDTLAFKRELCAMLGLKKHQLRVFRQGENMVIQKKAWLPMPNAHELFAYRYLL